jgi:hypothetical protein
MIIRGIAFRTWRPMVSNDIAIKVAIAERPRWKPHTTTYGLYPNPYQNVSSYYVFPPPIQGIATDVFNGTFRTVKAPPSGLPAAVAAAATGRDDFNVYVPFDVPFTFSGATNGVDALHIWITVQDVNQPGFVVDGLWDGQGQPVDSYRVSWDSFNGRPISDSTTYEGHVPVIGLIGESVPSTRELRLLSYGEPWSGSSGLCNFGVQLFSGVADGAVVLYYRYGGLLATGVPIAGNPCCAAWIDVTDPQIVALADVTDAFGMSNIRVPVLPGRVHEELGLQAVVLSTSGVWATNALRVQVGGGL